MKIAVLFENCQTLDVACLDVLGNCGKEYISSLASVPAFAALLPYAVEMEYIYLSSGSAPSPMTIGLTCVPNTTYAEAPVDVDMVFVGGSLTHNEDSLQYMRAVYADPKPKVIMTVCTGGAWVADSGILDGLNATTNRGLLQSARDSYPSVHWKDQRWVVDQRGHVEFWTSGGAVADEGMDMVLEYVKRHFHPLIANMSGGSLDMMARGVEYETQETEQIMCQL
ncbi:uncharacterized protein ACLA_032950 [Aspergillus clavatus NRRL 1]|uniref:DJ-1/PfpI domain-containing protein n=1 Tax=Aspergillus clavatus (strain ATCC 1007 / CBS 513.65 / DSM 816 / NCTC 3887 / NRRL 1 / QM 1276 / 107) TaxID=344612 RepID=A1CSD8_ASPCL|nr:uncharacterized protein ACLA_032950 [Aspergillus clavatus NRRL 1]EAW08559.1 conserved hypothetical protein [Aspergillus clavatus NRRL 1]